MRGQVSVMSSGRGRRTRCFAVGGMSVVVLTTGCSGKKKQVETDSAKFHEHVEEVKAANGAKFEVKDFRRITDDDVAELSELTQLEELSLENAPISDAAVPSLLPLKNLKLLILNKTRITD